MTISEKIKKIRNDLAYTQIEFAKELNCNRQKIADWERGKSTPSTGDIALLCGKFGLSADYLLDVDSAEKAVETYIIYFKDGDCIRIKADKIRSNSETYITFERDDITVAGFNWGEIIGYVSERALQANPVDELFRQYIEKEQN